MNRPFLDNEALSQIRRTADWRKLFQVLNLEKNEKKSKTNDWWAKSPFKPTERTASFHISDKGFKCFSSNEGGGVIELVQKVFQYRAGQVLNCYEAGQWLVDNGISPLPFSSPQQNSVSKPQNSGERKNRGERTENPPIRQNLCPSLTIDHPEFERRGLSSATAEYLGFGYLPPKKSRSRLAGRIVFQVCGVRKDGESNLNSVILTHMGRATTKKQEATDGKWLHYTGFRKSQELYNLDRLLLDSKARDETKKAGYVVIVEGCWDVAKLYETGIPNVVATFGAHISEEQIPRFKMIADHLGISHFRFLYDRDKAGEEGKLRGIETLNKAGFEADSFAWDQTFPSPSRGQINLPDNIQDVCDFRVDQLRWLRGNGYI